MIEIIKYNSERKQEWDDFVSNAKNGTFLFYRDYMDYHSDRFTDYSLMIYSKNKLIALFPANIVGERVYSHQGLTFGGIVSDKTMKAALMLQVFEVLMTQLKEDKIKTLIYKCIPYIYHNYPANEDLYALFKSEAVLIKRDISTTIQLNDRYPYNQLRKRKIKQANKADLHIEAIKSVDELYPLLEKNLNEKHKAIPVHNKEELNLLKSNFPKHIQFYICKDANHIPISGCVVYINKQIVHMQYICSNETGRQMGALDLLFDYLINKVFADKQYFDFGISTEESGQFLNEGLISQKEGFGGRGICYDTYEIKIQ